MNNNFKAAFSSTSQGFNTKTGIINQEFNIKAGTINQGFDTKTEKINQEFNTKTGAINQGFNTKIGQMNVSSSSLKPKISFVELLASAWLQRNDSLYSQIVNIEDVTENSQVDLTPDVQQLVTFYEKDLTFVTENEDGVVTIYAIGQKPMNDYTIQVTITEVRE